jgi:hypothetical protein
VSTLKSSAENLTLNADGSGNDIKFQSNGVEKASIDQDGVITAGGAVMTGNIAYVNMTTGDSGSTTNKIRMGAGSDLVIHHDGSNSYIEDTGTGSLRILSSHSEFKNTGDSTIFVRIDSDGLKFGSDTAAANALDDYEEGTWTPTNNGGSISLSVNEANYTKIGRLVTVQAYLGTSADGDGTEMRIGGLPFAAHNTTYESAIGRFSTYGDTANVYVSTTSGQTYLWVITKNTFLNEDDVDGAGGDWNFSLTYHTN